MLREALASVQLPKLSYHMRLLALLSLTTLVYSCATIHSYSYDFNNPIPPDTTIFLVQEGGNPVLFTLMATELRQAGFQVAGNNEFPLLVNGPEVHITATDTTYSEYAGYPVVEELFARPDFDYVLRYSPRVWSINQQGIGNFSATLIDARSGVIIGTFIHRGYVLGQDVPEFLSTVALAIRDGRIEDYLNPRRAKRNQNYPHRNPTE